MYRKNVLPIHRRTYWQKKTISSATAQLLYILLEPDFIGHQRYVTEIRTHLLP